MACCRLSVYVQRYFLSSLFKKKSHRNITVGPVYRKTIVKQVLEINDRKQCEFWVLTGMKELFCAAESGSDKGKPEEETVRHDSKKTPVGVAQRFLGNVS